MMRIWKKTSIGLGLSLVLGGYGSLRAELPRLAENLEGETAESPLDAALNEEVFHPNGPAQFGNYYCPPRRFGLPPMIGDFFPGYTGGARQTNIADRLFIVADDLDSPNMLPPADQVLTITEPGPVGIFRSSITSIQEIQATLRAGGMLPVPTSAGSVNADATLTTAISIGEIQALLASTPGLAFDIIPLIAPPGTYLSAVDAVFQSTNSGGVTTFDSAASGALLQGGADTLNGGEDLDAFYFYNYVLTVNVPTPSAGTAGVGRSRIAENGTTTPQDRIFFDYGYFNDVGMIAGDNKIHRYKLGFETTFADGAGSFELRVPFASTIDNEIFEDGRTNKDKLNLGNVTAYLKLLLREQNSTGVSAGLGLSLPTADGFSVNFVNGGRLIDIDNKSYHLQPFLSGYYAPNHRFFMQGFAQLDFDLNGNPVEINSTGAGLQQVGRLDDSAFLFLDWSVGYWMIRGDNAPVLPTSSFGEYGEIRQSYHQIGLAPTMELHYARSLENADTVSSGAFQIGNFADDVETLTLVLGTHLEIGQDTNIGLGYATALMGGNDKPFDGALRLTVNRFFGRK